MITMDPKNQKPTKKISSEKVKKSKKKRKHRKHSGKSDVKESSRSTDVDHGLEIEGVGVLEDSQNDSSYTPSPSFKGNAVQLLSSPTDDEVQSSQVDQVTKLSPDHDVQVLTNIKKSIRLVPIEELTNTTLSLTKSESNQSAMVDIVNSVSTLSLKNKTNASRTPRTKGQNSSKAVSRSKKMDVKVLYSPNNIGLSQNVDLSKKTESMRWDNVLDDSDAERERIREYKINRRKRYLEAANSKGLGWVLNYGKNGSPVSDSGIESLQESVIPDFSSVRTLRTSLSHPVLPEVGMV